MKSANQLYREYKAGGGTLIFKHWLQREKEKSFVNYDGKTNVPLNKPLNDSIQNVINEMNAAAGYKTDLENKYIFGVHRHVWMGIGITALAVTAVIIIYKRTKKP